MFSICVCVVEMEEGFKDPLVRTVFATWEFQLIQFF